MSGAECRRSRVQESLLSGKQAGSFPSLFSLRYRQLVWSISTICTSINGLKQDGGCVSVMITKCPPPVCRIAPKIEDGQRQGCIRESQKLTCQVLTLAEVDNQQSLRRSKLRKPKRPKRYLFSFELKLSTSDALIYLKDWCHLSPVL